MRFALGLLFLGYRIRTPRARVEERVVVIGVVGRWELRGVSALRCSNRRLWIPRVYLEGARVVFCVVGYSRDLPCRGQR